MTVIGRDNVVTLAHGRSSAGHQELSLDTPVVAVGGIAGVSIMVYDLIFAHYLNVLNIFIDCIADLT